MVAGGHDPLLDPLGAFPVLEAGDFVEEPPPARGRGGRGGAGEEVPQQRRGASARLVA